MPDPLQSMVLATLLAAGGMWLLLPRGAARGRALGPLLAAAGAGIWLAEVPRIQGWMADSTFLVMAGVTIVAAVAAVSLANPVYCAIWFGMSLVGTAGLLLYLGAQFLAVATLLVYAGAILVTFLFVLMLAQPQGRAHYDRASWEALVSAATGAVMVGVLSLTFAAALAHWPSQGCFGHVATAEQRAEGVLADAHVARLGQELFGRHLLAIEVAGTLLLAALVGTAAIVAPGTEEETRAKTQRRQEDA